MVNQLFGELFGGVEQKAAADAAVIFDRLEQLLLMLFAHARQSADFSFTGQGLHSVEIADLVGAPDKCDGLGAQALDLEQLEHRRAIFL